MLQVGTITVYYYSFGGLGAPVLLSACLYPLRLTMGEAVVFETPQEPREFRADSDICELAITSLFSLLECVSQPSWIAVLRV